MIETYFGEIAALITAVFWTITALAFEFATKKVGTYPVNIIRLTTAFFLVGITTFFTRGMFFPTDASVSAWFWLSISGLIGFVLGDLFLFSSYTLIGSRVAMLIMTLAPPATAVLSYFILNESLTRNSWLGMLLVIFGISLTILGKPVKGKRVSFSYPAKGLLFAFLGAMGQAGGLVLSKLGMGDYNPLAATQIRIIAGITGFVLLITVLGKWRQVRATLIQKKPMGGIAVGSFFGPFLGVTFSMIAIQHTSAGVAATLMSIVPVIIIAPAYFLFKQKVTIKEIIGAVISVAGVAMFFI
jgi:drug/metabolite transporter (DMT)-like permease